MQSQLSEYEDYSLIEQLIGFSISQFMRKVPENAIQRLLLVLTIQSELRRLGWYGKRSNLGTKETSLTLKEVSDGDKASGERKGETPEEQLKQSGESKSDQMSKVEERARGGNLVTPIVSNEVKEDNRFGFFSLVKTLYENEGVFRASTKALISDALFFSIPNFLYDVLVSQFIIGNVMNYLMRKFMAPEAFTPSKELLLTLLHSTISMVLAIPFTSIRETVITHMHADIKPSPQAFYHSVYARGVAYRAAKRRAAAAAKIVLGGTATTAEATEKTTEVNKTPPMTEHDGSGSFDSITDKVEDKTATCGSEPEDIENPFIVDTTKVRPRYRYKSSLDCLSRIYYGNKYYYEGEDKGEEESRWDEIGGVSAVGGGNSNINNAASGSDDGNGVGARLNVSNIGGVDSSNNNKAPFNPLNPRSSISNSSFSSLNYSDYVSSTNDNPSFVEYFNFVNRGNNNGNNRPITSAKEIVYDRGNVNIFNTSGVVGFSSLLLSNVNDNNNTPVQQQQFLRLLEGQRRREWEQLGYLAFLRLNRRNAFLRTVVIKLSMKGQERGEKKTNERGDCYDKSTGDQNVISGGGGDKNEAQKEKEREEIAVENLTMAKERGFFSTLSRSFYHRGAILGVLSMLIYRGLYYSTFTLLATAAARNEALFPSDRPQVGGDLGGLNGLSVGGSCDGKRSFLSSVLSLSFISGETLQRWQVPIAFALTLLCGVVTQPLEVIRRRMMLAVNVDVTDYASFVNNSVDKDNDIDNNNKRGNGWSGKKNVEEEGTGIGGIYLYTDGCYDFPLLLEKTFNGNDNTLGNFKSNQSLTSLPSTRQISSLEEGNNNNNNNSGKKDNDSARDEIGAVGEKEDKDNNNCKSTPVLAGINSSGTSNNNKPLIPYQVITISGRPYRTITDCVKSIIYTDSILKFQRHYRKIVTLTAKDRETFGVDDLCTCTCVCECCQRKRLRQILKVISLCSSSNSSLGNLSSNSFSNFFSLNSQQGKKTKRGEESGVSHEDMVNKEDDDNNLSIGNSFGAKIYRCHRCGCGCSVTVNNNNNGNAVNNNSIDRSSQGDDGGGVNNTSLTVLDNNNNNNNITNTSNLVDENEEDNNNTDEDFGNPENVRIYNTVIKPNYFALFEGLRIRIGFSCILLLVRMLSAGSGDGEGRGRQ